jgi:hypothetical protein
MQDSIEDRLIQLLTRTKDEHAEYEKSVLNGVYDQQWDLWYADFLVEHGLNDLLNSNLISADLATLLRDINDEYEKAGKKGSWEGYTAVQLIDTVSGPPRTN